MLSQPRRLGIALEEALLWMLPALEPDEVGKASPGSSNWWKEDRIMTPTWYKSHRTVPQPSLPYVAPQPSSGPRRALHGPGPRGRTLPGPKRAPQA